MTRHLWIETATFVVACVVAWYPGNRLIWFLWTLIARFVEIPRNQPSKLAPAIGGLERILYIYSVMSRRYEILTGWLVMKAFFSWIDPRATPGAAAHVGNDTPDPKDTALLTYNSFLIGNVTSLLSGLLIGIIANFSVRSLS